MCLLTVVEELFYWTFDLRKHLTRIPNQGLTISSDRSQQIAVLWRELKTINSFSFMVVELMSRSEWLPDVNYSYVVLLQRDECDLVIVNLVLGQAH